MTLAGVAGIAIAAPASAASPTADAALTRLVDAFVAAQRDFDPRALAALTTPDYVEVSPAGEVDTRAAMLGFYAPDKKTPAPPIAVSERSVRVEGNTAIVMAKLSMTVPAAVGVTRSVDLRATYVARRTGAAWRLAGAQFTPIRAAGGPKP